MLTGGNAEGKVAEDRIIRPVGKAHVLKDHLSTTTRHVRTSALGLGDLEGLLHQLANAFHSRQPTLNLGETLRQLTQRVEQTLGGKDECGEGA